MNKIDEAWAVLRKLSAQEQEWLAEIILDFAASANDFGLTDEQVAEVERRLADPNPEYVTMAEARARMTKLYS